MTEKSFHWPGRRADDPAHDMLVAFLVMDIQRNREWAWDLAGRIAEVESGRRPVWERIGNAYRLEMTDQGALIEDLVDEDAPAQTIAMGDFSKAVQAWIKSIEAED